MRATLCSALLPLSLVVCADAVGAEPGPARSALERITFKRTTPCPENGKSRGACPGWEIDHINPLCAGGADHRSNMQWIRREDHRLKTLVDVRECRRRKAPAYSPSP